MAESEKEIQQETAETAAPANEPKEEKPKKKMSAAARKKFKYGGLATAITCVVVAIVVVVNVLVSTLVEKYPLKLDLTESAMYEISQETIDYVQSIEEEVNFTVLMDESNFQTSGTYLKMVHEILQKYTQYSDKINLTYVDPTKNPDVVNQYQEHYTGTLTNGDVVIANAADPSKMRVVKVDNMFTYDQEKYYYYMYYGYYTLEDCITAFTGEKDLTSSLMYVTDSNPVRVAILSMVNGEPLYNSNSNYYSLGMFADTLNRNGYDITEVDLIADPVSPEEYDMIILPAPVNDLTEEAVNKISDFLYNDGKYERDMIYFADITQSSTPNLDAMLATWGIEVTRNLAVAGEENNAQVVSIAMGGQKIQAGALLASIADESYAANLGNASLPIPAVFCRPIKLLWESQTGGITSVLLKTAEDKVLIRELGSKEEGGNYSTEAQNLAVISKRRTGDTVETLAESNLMVFGSMMLADYYIMQDTAYNNAEYFMSAINTMTGKGSGLIIAQKDLTKSTLTIDQAQLNAVNVVLYGIPFVVVVIGIVVFLRRKNK